MLTSAVFWTKQNSEPLCCGNLFHPMGQVCIKKLDYITEWQYFLFLFLDFFGYCFMWLENQIPDMNLQMGISAKVGDIMIKVADYSVKWLLHFFFF